MDPFATDADASPGAEPNESEGILSLNLVLTAHTISQYSMFIRRHRASRPRKQLAATTARTTFPGPVSTPEDHQEFNRVYGEDVYALATRIRTNVDNAVVQFQRTTAHPGLCVTTSSNVLERSTLTAHNTYTIDSRGASHPLQHGYILRTCVGTKLGTYLLNKGNGFIVTTFGPNVGIPCITTSVSMQFILDTEGSP
jgi:hypothetical protein